MPIAAPSGAARNHVALEPDFHPPANALPDCTFVVDVPDDDAARVSDNDAIEWLVLRLALAPASPRQVIHMSAADLVMCAIACGNAGVYGVKLVESIVMPAPKGEA